MNYVPHTKAQEEEMLDRIGVENVEALFESVPPDYRFPSVELPEPVSEIEIMRELREVAESNADLQHVSCFLGAGAYHHYVPSVVDHVVSRSEFYTAYTPYQPEISQGTLQSIFEYQSMICDLTSMEVSNASHYDGATAMAESVIMAYNVSRGRRNKVIISPTVHPEYLATVRTYMQGMEMDIVAPRDPSADLDWLIDQVDENTACLIVQNPDFLGRIHDLNDVAEKVHAHGALLVVACDPISLGLLKPPGDMDADIALGEGQPLGNPLNYGGPYLGFFTCKKNFVRRMAGRLVGQTTDVEGRRGYVLTLATREQHIRRERATSNICTNEGLNALAAAVYLAALGKCGLKQVAELCYHRAHYAAKAIDRLADYSVDFDMPFFKEFVVRCPTSVAEINERLLQDYDILGGYDLGRAYPKLQNHMLVCVTEMNSAQQIDDLVSALEEVGRS
ncbi:MAG: aminomethyl-transferring glycine dehydrogenase subunit GcvPA [Chloroflexota bacterium]|nr:aminomethyl-transferring glycine dehydrogenase subunit GcvPA [Chloroflexota bacterium]